MGPTVSVSKGICRDQPGGISSARHADTTVKMPGDGRRTDILNLWSATFSDGLSPSAPLATAASGQTARWPDGSIFVPLTRF